MQLVSFIIPCLNCKRTIGRSILSAMNQVGVEKEIIVIDDGSIQNIKKEISKYKDYRLKYIRLEENKGPAIARNIGLSIANGSWIQFLDADDKISKFKCNEQVLNSGVSDIIISDWIKIYTNQNKQIRYRNFIKNGPASIYDFVDRNPFPIHAALIRESFIKKIEGFNKKIFHEDWEFWIRASTQKPVIKYVRGYYSFYYRYEKAKNYDRIVNYKEEIECLNYIMQRSYINTEKLKKKIKKSIRNKTIALAVEQAKASLKKEAQSTINGLSPPATKKERLEVALAELPILKKFYGMFPGPKKIKRWNFFLLNWFLNEFRNYPKQK